MIKFLSGLEGYIDQLETEAKEERRAKKLRDRLRIQTVSSDDDSDDTTTDDDWEDCSIDSDEFMKELINTLVNQVYDSDCSDDSDIFRRYAANQMYDSDDFGVDEDGRSFYVKNGYRMYSDGEYEYEYERAVYWD